MFAVVDVWSNRAELCWFPIVCKRIVWRWSIIITFIALSNDQHYFLGFLHIKMVVGKYINCVYELRLRCYSEKIFIYYTCISVPRQYIPSHADIRYFFKAQTVSRYSVWNGFDDIMIVMVGLFGFRVS